MKSLDIRVSFGAIDRLTRPTENARRQVGALTESLQKTQNNIQALDRQSKVFDRAAGNLSKYREQIARAEQRLAGLRKAEQDGNTLSEKQREMMTALSARLERLNELRTRERENFRRRQGKCADTAFCFPVAAGPSKVPFAAHSSTTSSSSANGRCWLA